MPHATIAATGFQAFILCGPGESLNPFNSNPKDFPKCLIPIANRPMVWYPLEWCHRMGISNIHLIISPESANALDAAVSQNPYLTSLPSPRPTLLAPSDLDLTTGTAEIFQLPEVQKAVVGDFVVLPCDLVCELAGTSLLESWMSLHGSSHNERGSQDSKGGLGVWYETKDASEGGVGVKKEETDFLATTPIPPVPAPGPINSSLVPRIRNVTLSMPTDSLKDKMGDEQSLRVRTALLRRHGCVRMNVSHRDAHIYFLPYWVKSYLQRNDSFESIGEDVLGWWAKAGWQSGLAQKLCMDEALKPAKRRRSEPEPRNEIDDFDLTQLSSTGIADLTIRDSGSDLQRSDAPFATRVQAEEDRPNGTSSRPSNKSIQVPPLLAYFHPSHHVPASTDAPNQKQKQQKQQKHTPSSEQAPTPQPPPPLIRRTDTVPLLLSVSLYLARIGSILDQFPPSAKSEHPYLPTQQVHPTTTLPSQATIHTPTCLIDANVTLSPRITVRDSVVGANCSIASGARLHGCLLMDGCVIEEKVVLSGCVLGRHVKVGKGAELRDVWAHEGFVVQEAAVVKGEILAGFEGVEGGSDEDMGENEGGGGLELSVG